MTRGKLKPDPELVKAQAEAKKKAEEERLAAEERAREEMAARLKGFRGLRSLLSGDRIGYPTLGG